MANLGTLFSLEATPRGGGNNSVKRLLSRHVEFIRQRQQAGEISESTFVGYAKCSRHFTRWFTIQGFERLSDIDRTTLMHYGLQRINDDGMAPTTVNLEIVYLRMWWRWLQDEEILSRPLRVNPIKQAVENRTSGMPFHGDDLKTIYKTLDEWVEAESEEGMFGMKKNPYNKKLFRLFIQLLDESGARQHEVLNRTWKEVKVGETQTDDKMIINTVNIPQQSKRGARQTVFRGDSLVKLRQLQQDYCVDWSTSDFLFRNLQTNTRVDQSTFSRYWTAIRKLCDLDYPLHTFRSHRITQLILGGVEPQLVGRNLGVSTAQIEKTYLRFVPAGHYEKLIQQDIEKDSELRVMFNRLKPI